MTPVLAQATPAPTRGFDVLGVTPGVICAREAAAKVGAP